MSGYGPRMRRSPRPTLTGRRDRHGRGQRIDGGRERRPPQGFRARDAQRFRRLAADALRSVPAPVAQRLRGARVVVADVPGREAPAHAGTALEGVATLGLADGPPLAVFRPAGRGELWLYRRTIESRATSRDDLLDLVAEAATEAVARAHGWDDGPEGPAGW